jgi:hypothetical protein
MGLRLLELSVFLVTAGIALVAPRLHAKDAEGRRGFDREEAHGPIPALLANLTWRSPRFLLQGVQELRECVNAGWRRRDAVPGCPPLQEFQDGFEG